MSVTLRFADEIDITRGDLICKPDDAPQLSREFSADSAGWRTHRGRRRAYSIKHATHAARAVVDEIR